MTRRFTVSFVAAVIVLALALGSGAGAGMEQASRRGEWSAPFAELEKFAKRPPKTIKESLEIPPAVSMAVLPDGRVIYWGGLEGLENARKPLAAGGALAARKSRSRILDLRDGSPTWEIPDKQTGGAHDMFCADLRLLANGKLIVAGGTIWKGDPVDLRGVTGDDQAGTTELFGSNSVRTFDHQTESWEVQKEWMNHSRWYPTMITLPSGKVLVVSGVERLIYNDRGLNVHATETYDPETGEWKNNGADGATSLPLFARIHLLPDGKVFYSGVGQMWGPFGQAADEALWNIQKIYDPRGNTWTPAGIGSYGARNGAISVMRQLKPPYDKAEIVVAGGTLGTSPGNYLANDLTEIITVKDGQATSESGPNLNNPRWYSSGVSLPDGNIVMVSGGNSDEVIAPGTEEPVRHAEMFDGKKWIPLGKAGRSRTYHNTAVLLADGSVLVGGHSPINGGYGPGGPNSMESVTGSSSFKDPSFEILRPPYLFRGDRPEIDSVQKGLAWGERFAIRSSHANKVKKVALVRLPTTTHTVDADMRSIELPFDLTDSRTLDVKNAPDGNVAPPGYYYLFLLADNGEGLTPSKARIVRVGPKAIGGEAVAPMGK